MEASTELVQLLMEIGFAGVSAGLTSDALKVFDGVHAVRPESELPLVGRSIVEMRANRSEDAVNTLESALNTNPESPYARCYLGLALTLSGESEKGQMVLKDVVSANKNAAVVALAERLLTAEGDEP